MSQDPDQHHMRAWTVVAVSAALSTAITGCSALGAGSPTTEAFGHVHGLGVNPTSGDIYIATHTGVWDLDPETQNNDQTRLSGPIGGRAQDTMGFTVADDLLFGSGHPDPAELGDLPPNLGLIVSTDQATTWDSVSLLGEVDFHDITVTGTDDDEFIVYGYDSAAGLVQVSPDSGRTWSVGATIVARDLTVDTVTGSVYATTAAGLQVSHDQAVTFTLVPDAPALYLVERMPGTEGGLIGVDQDGTLWTHSTADGWSEAGATEGMVEALTYSVSPTSLLVIADGRGISTSTDEGGSWTTVIGTQPGDTSGQSIDG